MIELGALSIWLALLMALWGIVTGAGGVMRRRDDLAESAIRSLVAAGFFVTLGLAGLLDALLGADLSVRYAARHVTRILPPLWRLAALWSGVEGRVLAWAFFVVVVAGVFAVTSRARDATTRGRLYTAMAAAIAVAVALAAIGANAFVRLGAVPIEGAGLSPLLRDPGFLLAPPLLLLGCAMTMPLGALAGAAVVARRVTADDIRAIRAWGRASWTVLSLGLAASLWWRSRVSGDTAGWVSDALAAPVFVPWLALLVALHAMARLTPHRRGTDLTRLALVLAAAACLLTLPVPIATLLPAPENASLVDWSRAAAWLAVGLCITAIALSSARLSAGSPSEAPSPASARVPEVARAAAPLAHAGFVLVLIAIAGSMLRADHELVLRVGEPVGIRDPYGLHWELVAQGISRYEAEDGGALALGVQLRQGGGAGAPALVSSAARAWVDGRGVPVGEPYVTTGLHGTALEQVRVRLLEVIDEGRSRVRVSFVPLAWLMWLGAACIVGGGAIALWPTPTARPPVTDSAGSTGGTPDPRRTA